MKSLTRLFWNLTVALILSSGVAQAQYSVNIVGYVNHPFATGENLFSNPLHAGTNTLSNLFPSAPNGTTISLWDSLTSGYNLSSTFNAGAWSVNLTLDPGTGAHLNAPSAFINTFVGNVVGLVMGPGDIPQPPAPLNLDPGTYLLGSVPPLGLSDPSYPAFLYVLGRAPRHGESFTWLNEVTQTWYTTTYNESTGQWSNGSPTLAVSGAAFFTVVAVPEPSAFALLALGAVGMMRFGRRRA